MSLWLIRAGRHGEFESKFLEENRVYVTWLNLAPTGRSKPNKVELPHKRIWTEAAQEEE